VNIADVAKKGFKALFCFPIHLRLKGYRRMSTFLQSNTRAVDF